MATRVIAAQDKTSSGAGDDVQIKAGSANTSGAGGSIIIQPGAQATSGGDGIVIVRQPSGTAGTDEIQLLHNGSRGSIINKDGALQLGGANIAIRNVANNANTTLTATTLYATGIYSSNVINADGVTSDSYTWGIDDSSLNWSQGFNLRVGWSHIRGYANCGIAYTGNNTNGRRATLEVTDGSTGGGAWAYRSATTTVNTSYNDLNLAGHSAFQRLNATAATTITGIAPASTAGGSGFPTWIHTDGRIFWLYNVGTFNITLANESASSTAGNRVTTQTGANVILGPDRMMQIVYDGTSSRWRTSGETYPYVFPTTDGTNGQVLTTNGSGTLSWTTVTGGVTGTGTTGNFTKFTGTNTVGNSAATESTNAEGFNIFTYGGQVNVGSSVSGAGNFTRSLIVTNATKGNAIEITKTIADGNNAAISASSAGGYIGAFYSTATTTKGLMVRGASGQTANLQEWQDSAGTVLGYVTASGNISFPTGNQGSEKFGDSAIASGITSTAIGRSASATGSDTVALGASAQASASSAVALGQGAVASASSAIAIGKSVSNSTANSVAIGTSSNTLNVFYGTLRTYMPSAATTGAIIRGFASQTANLTEWQDNTGAVVAAVSPTGAFTGSSFTPYGTFNSTTTIFGNNYWTPNYTGGVTSPSAGTYTKSTGSANVWNGQVYSSEGYTKNVYCAARASQTNGHIMFGLNSDPVTDGNYTSLDYAWYFLDSAILVIYENGVQVASYGAYTTSTVLSITYDGSNVQYWKDGVIQRTVARSTGNPLYFDTSFYTLSSSLNSVQFGPIGQPFGISGTSGYLPKFTSQQTLGNSVVYDNGTNVGIGTASPSSKFDVNAGTGSNFRAAFAATNQIEIGNYSAASGYRELSIAGSPITLYTGTAGGGGVSERVRIDSSGNVGVGTSTSLNGIFTPLHVNAVSSYGSILSSQATATVVADSGGELQFAATYRTTYGGGDLTQVARIKGLRENATVNNWAGYLAFYTSTGSDSPSASTERMRINSSGNVGIGNVSPGARLQVDTGATGTKGQIIKAVASQTANLSEWQNNSGTALSYVASNGDIYSTTSFIHSSAGNSGYYLKRASDNATIGSFTWSSGSTEAGLYSLTFLNFDAGGSGIRMGSWTTWADSVSAQVMWLKNSNIIWGNNALGVTGRTAFNTSAFQITAGSYATIPAPTSRFEVYGDSQFLSQSTSAKTVVVKAAASQTANLTEWQNNGGTALAYMDANGNFFAVSKSFLIPHPTPAKAAEGKKLRYASLEGPENGVYYRGRLEGESEIVLPDYWKDLVDPESITVNLTARKFAQPSLFVVDANAEKVIVESDREINCDFVVFATRRDIAKLEVEPDGE